MREWVAAAMEFAGIKQSELQRRLSERYGWPEGRSKINKLLTTQQLGAVEMLQIADVTGYPLPSAEPGKGGDWSARLSLVIDFARNSGASDSEIVRGFANIVPLAVVPASSAGQAGITVGKESAEQLQAAIATIQNILVGETKS